MSGWGQATGDPLQLLMLLNSLHNLEIVLESGIFSSLLFPFSGIKSAEEQLKITPWLLHHLRGPERWWELQTDLLRRLHAAALVGTCWMGAGGHLLPSDQAATLGPGAVTSAPGTVCAPWIPLCSPPSQQWPALPLPPVADFLCRGKQRRDSRDARGGSWERETRAPRPACPRRPSRQTLRGSVLVVAGMAVSTKHRDSFAYSEHWRAGSQKTPPVLEVSPGAWSHREFRLLEAAWPWWGGFQEESDQQEEWLLWQQGTSAQHAGWYSWTLSYWHQPSFQWPWWRELPAEASSRFSRFRGNYITFPF